MRELYIHYNENLISTIQEDADGVLILNYSDSWLGAKDAFPLSLALKLRQESYRGKVVTAFFENLLPEGEQRRQIENLAQLPGNDDLAFLERFGEDCAGALTVSKFPTRAHLNSTRAKEVEVTYEAIEKSIQEGKSVQYALDVGGELPPFSLSGAQAKFPCIVRGDSIVLPRSGEPTTHIIKLPIRAGEKLLDSVENEFLCMRLASKSGLTVPQVRLIGKKIPLFAIERFDRIGTNHGIQRLHTQDLCQALGRPSKEKYERHGGPTFAECYALLRDNSRQIPADVLSLLDWIGFNLAIGNNDSHAKNLSLIHENHSLRLAPYYDLISTALYSQYSPHFAFKIGEVSSWDKVSLKQLEAFAKKIGVTVALINRRWQSLFDRMESALQALGNDYGGDPKLKKTLGKIEKEITKRIDSLRKNLEKKINR
jgi:serine/threonine-protein kinase HipA